MKNYRILIVIGVVVIFLLAAMLLLGRWGRCKQEGQPTPMCNPATGEVVEVEDCSEARVLPGWWIRYEIESFFTSRCDQRLTTELE